MDTLSNWCIKLDNENRDIVIGYLNEKYNFCLEGSEKYYGINKNGNLDCWYSIGNSITEITTEEFIEMIKKEGYIVDYRESINKYYLVTNGYKSEIIGTSTNNPPINEYKNIFDKTLSNLADLLKYKNEKYGNSALEPLEIFSNKCKVGTRLDDKLARVKNSNELKKNDIADLIGYLTLICVENNWSNFDEFKD